MLSSKEALERIGNYPIGNFGIFTIYDKFKEDFDLITQDLERLEKIENLRTTPNALESCLAKYMNKCINLETEYYNLQKDYDEKDLENIRLEGETQDLLIALENKNKEIKKLEKENQELKYEYKLIREKKEKCIDYLCDRNQKLVKAIEIIKPVINIEVVKCENGYLHCVHVGDISISLSKEEYELLKEVLEDE